MSSDQKQNSPQPADEKFTTADSGNASNPSPQDETMKPSSDNQLISEKGEKYLREVSSPEDYPDAQDEQEAENTVKETTTTKDE